MLPSILYIHGTVHISEGFKLIRTFFNGSSDIGDQRPDCIKLEMIESHFKEIYDCRWCCKELLKKSKKTELNNYVSEYEINDICCRVTWHELSKKYL